MTTFTINNIEWKTNDKNYFAKVVDGKTIPAKREEYEAAKAEFDKGQPAPAPEAKTKKPAKPVVPTKKGLEYTISEDTRGRISYKQDKTILVMVQPAKTHFTLYVSKSVLSKPEEVLDALKKYKVEAMVNPTFKRNEGRDPFSVKATLREATRDQLPDVLEAIIKKNNEAYA